MSKKGLDEENTRIIRIRSGLPLTMRHKFLKEEEERIQLIPDYQRGKIQQKLEDRDLLVTTPSKLLVTHIDKFLEHTEFLVKEGKISPDRAGKIITVIQYYKKWTPINNVEKIGDKKHVDEYYKHLSQKVIDGEFSAHYARDIFAIWKQFLRWLYDEEIIKQFPKCLDRKDQKYKIKVVPKKVKTVAIQDVHTILEQANPRLQLCMLLTLNCGFGSAELGRLKKDQYNPKTGRITHKRIKTGGKSLSVPEVVYLLWERTKELLDQHLKEQKEMFPKRSEYADYLLLNENGRPLWTSRLEDGKYKKSDNISCNFKRLVSALQKQKKIPHVNYYKLRKLPPSLIFNSRQFGELYRLWLGHAPKSVAERSYIETSDTVLDECILWLEQQIFESQNLDPVDEISESVEEQVE